VAVIDVVRRLGAAAQVPVFVLQGVDGGPAGDAERLRCDPRLAVVDSPRHATVLLVAGALPPELHDPAALVHDALPHPRGTVRWGAATDGWGATLELSATPTDGDVAAAVVATHRGLVDGTRPSEPPLLSATRREPWRGVGPYGHGGSGMTGGVPHGRRLPDRADDLRDGLKLDALPVVVGPFFPAFPVGLTLDVVLQGDLVQEAQVRGTPFVGPNAAPEDVLTRATAEPVPVAALEQARAVHHLRTIARTLRLLGLEALAARVLRLALGPPDALMAAAPRMLRLLRRTPVERSLPPAGVLATTSWPGHGFTSRAGGLPLDARTDDPAYDSLGFAPVCADGGDARSRWRQRLAEIEQSIRLATGAGTRLREPGPVVEDPASVTAELLPLLPDLLVGLEWGDAVSVVDSLDLDLRRGAAVPQAAS
jgi:hypothetical protein